MTEMTLKEIATELKKFDSALIFSHARPDGDTLGSAMALKTALINLGMEADVVCASDIPEKYDIFPAFKTIKKPAEINKNTPRTFPSIFRWKVCSATVIIFTRKTRIFSI